MQYARFVPGKHHFAWLGPHMVHVHDRHGFDIRTNTARCYAATTHEQGVARALDALNPSRGKSISERVHRRHAATVLMMVVQT